MAYGKRDDERMKAIKFLGNKELEIIDIPKPEPAKGQALVKVMAASICRTDIELLYNQPLKTDVIPGHEISGIIKKVNMAGDFKAGDRVFLNVHITCGKCKYCNAGDWIFCPELSCIGFDKDGGDAEYMIAPKGILRKLPDDISYELGSLIPDALGTPYHAVKIAELKESDNLGIIGMGPLGLAAVISAAGSGARIFALDIIEQRLKFARKFGAEKVLNPKKDNIKELIKRETGGCGLDKVIDCTGSANAIKLGLDILKVSGKFISVGVCTDLCLNTFEHVIAKELQLIGSRNFNESELNEIIDLARKNPQVKDMITHRFPFSQAKEAFRIAEKTEGIKIILVPENQTVE